MLKKLDIELTIGGSKIIFPAVELAQASYLVDDYELISLHASLSQADQNRIFRKGKKRKIICSTNIAETSITIDTVHKAVDHLIKEMNILRPDAASMSRIEANTLWNNLLQHYQLLVKACIYAY